MAKAHKAATQVTIASTTEETLLHKVVHRYWRTAAVIAVLVGVGILVREWKVSRTAAEMARSWDRLEEEVSLGAGLFGQVQASDADVLARLADDLREAPAGPWAKALEVRAHLDKNEIEEAKAALRDLETTWPDHPLVARAMIFEEGGNPVTLPNHLRRRLDAVEQWEKNHPNLFGNPPPPADAPRVTLHTTKGDIVLGLYPGRAPKHCANFLKLCREGFYDGTAFHRVVRDFMIQGGDPNSRDGEPDTWGQGGPGYTIPQEFSDLKHFRHVLAAAKKGDEVESSGSQFYITTGAPHHLDGQHTVFGAVLSGEDVIEEIESGAVVGDRPQDPVVIESVEIAGDSEDAGEAPAGGDEPAGDGE